MWEFLRRRQPIRQARPRSCHRAVKYSRLGTGRIPTLDTKYPVLSSSQLAQYHMSQAQNTQLLRFSPPAFSLPPPAFLDLLCFVLSPSYLFIAIHNALHSACCQPLGCGPRCQHAHRGRRCQTCLGLVQRAPGSSCRCQSMSPKKLKRSHWICASTRTNADVQRMHVGCHSRYHRGLQGRHLQGEDQPGCWCLP